MGDALFLTAVAVLAGAGVLIARYLRAQNENASASRPAASPESSNLPLETKLTNQHDAVAKVRPAALASTNDEQDKARPTCFESERAALAYLRRTGSAADILECTFQTSDSDAHDDYLKGAIAAYREEKCLRLIAENGEPDNPYWHTWEFAWSNIVAVIRRKRSTPAVRTDTQQADGIYARKGMYVQTRLYTMRRGIECRILSRELEDMNGDDVYRWLKRHILDDGVRYFEDSQDSPLFGDLPDKLDAASCRAESREQAWRRLESGQRGGA